MADSKVSAFPAATTPLTGTEQVPVVQGGVAKVTTVADIRFVDVVHSLTTTASSTSTTAAAVTGLDCVLAPGNWCVKLWLLWNTAATTTGIDVFLKATGGTVSHLAATWYTLTTGTSATSGIADQASSAGTFQTMEGRAQRASGVSGGPLGGTDTANADQFAVLEGIVVVTAQTTLQTMLATEVSSSAANLLIGTTVTCSKVA